MRGHRAVLGTLSTKCQIWKPASTREQKALRGAGTSQPSRFDGSGWEEVSEGAECLLNIVLLFAEIGLNAIEGNGPGGQGSIGAQGGLGSRSQGRAGSGWDQALSNPLGDGASAGAGF